MQPSNNARMHTVNTYFPVTNMVCVDEKQNIWKGERVVEQGTPDNVASIVFFSRTHDPENNDWDKINPPYEFKDTSIIGFKFWLIPKEKLLFGYDESATILRPNIKLTKPRFDGMGG